MSKRKLGDLESAILLAILEEAGKAFALEVRKNLEEATGRTVSRGSFYTSLERLGKKGFVSWESRVPPNARRALAQRQYSVTPAGLEALRETEARLTAQLKRLSDTVAKA